MAGVESGLTEQPEIPAGIGGMELGRTKEDDSCKGQMKAVRQRNRRNNPEIMVAELTVDTWLSRPIICDICHSSCQHSASPNASDNQSARAISTGMVCEALGVYKQLSGDQLESSAILVLGSLMPQEANVVSRAAGV